jgi:hypothetical protein
MQREKHISSQPSKTQQAIIAAQELRKKIRDQWISSYESLRETLGPIGIGLSPLAEQIAFPDIGPNVAAKFKNIEPIITAIKEKATWAQTKAILECLAKERIIFIRMSGEMEGKIDAIFKAGKERIKKFELAQKQLEAYAVMKDILALPALQGENEFEKINHIIEKFADLPAILSKINSYNRAKRLKDALNLAFMMNLAGGEESFILQLDLIKATAEQRTRVFVLAAQTIKLYNQLRAILTYLPPLEGAGDIEKARQIMVIFNERETNFSRLTEFLGSQKIGVKRQLYDFFSFRTIKALAGENEELGERFCEIREVLHDLCSQENTVNPKLTFAYQNFAKAAVELTVQIEPLPQAEEAITEYEILSRVETIDKEDIKYKIGLASQDLGTQGKLTHLLIQAEELKRFLEASGTALDKMSEICEFIKKRLHRQVEKFSAVRRKLYVDDALPIPHSPSKTPVHPQAVESSSPLRTPIKQIRLDSPLPKSARLSAKQKSAEQLAVVAKLAHTPRAQRREQDEEAIVVEAKRAEHDFLQAFSNIIGAIYDLLGIPDPKEELDYDEAMQRFSQIVQGEHNPLYKNAIFGALLQNEHKACKNREFRERIKPELLKLKEQMEKLTKLFLSFPPEKLVKIFGFAHTIIYNINRQLHEFEMLDR